MSFFDACMLGKLFCLILYFFISSQGAFYLLALGKVLRIIPPETFLKIRKVTEKVIGEPLKVLYPATLFCLLLWVISVRSSENLLGLYAVLFSLIMLLTDFTLAICVSMPLNKRIGELDNDFTGEVLLVKQKWIRFILIRGYLSVSGFTFLIIHLVSDTVVR